MSSQNTKPFYAKFRKCIISDLRDSARIKATGLTQILCEVVKYSFAGEPRLPPVPTRSLLTHLMTQDSALGYMVNRGKKVLYL
jgi:hypothetical protein